MPDLEALKSFRYATRRLKAGDYFDAAQPRDARILIGLGRARKRDQRQPELPMPGGSDRRYPPSADLEPVPVPGGDPAPGQPVPVPGDDGAEDPDALPWGEDDPAGVPVPVPGKPSRRANRPNRGRGK
jgi:hypothetical protein